MRRFLLIGLLLTILAPVTGFSVESEVKVTTPKDPAIINHERIVYWLKKNGQLNKGATEYQKQSALKAYLKGVEANSSQQPKIVQKAVAKQHDAYKHGKSLAYKNEQNKTVKVLAVLIDFPDLKHSSHGLSSSDTDMYYSSYPVSHYQNLMFSPTGFASRSGQNLSSVYQYFNKESGGTFSFTGDTFGWVTADNHASFYGENDPSNGYSDKDAPALVKEAVAKAVAANNINLADYDVEDPYDADGDGNLNEADGIIDHVLVYHSSIGEEAGGGLLSDDAIWSHRYYADINTRGYKIPGTDKKVFGYTIQPIDAATGIVAHEFGHALGLRDEYDTADSDEGSPVGYWSIMADGAWAGKVAGTEPTGFSPYAKAYLQSVHGGNWVNERVINFEELSTGSQSIELYEAVNSQEVNQVRIDMPKPKVDFAQPYAGNYQYYSGESNNLNNVLAFDVELPENATELSMKARWDMESERDYARVLVNGQPIAGNYTKSSNRYYDITHFITGKSIDLSTAEADLGWVDLTFDLSAFAGESVTISIEYVTDAGGTGYGLVIDELALNNGSDFYKDGAEKSGLVTLDGFLRIDDKRPGEAQNYWVQLRSERAQDSGLTDSIYTPGVLIWFADEAFSNNRVADHPGQGFIGVVDADQNPIMRNGDVAKSAIQVSDATFGLYAQKGYSSDAYLQPNAKFDDSQDYSLPEQPESGLILPTHGLSIEVIEQAANSSTATVLISKVSKEFTADFDFTVNAKTVSFSSHVSSDAGDYQYQWDFGDDSAVSNAKNAKHSYQQYGSYTVTLTVTNGDNQVSTVTKTIKVMNIVQADIKANLDGRLLSLSAELSQEGNYNYHWDFGDGATSNEVSPSHTYSSDGSYTVTLVLTNNEGLETKVSEKVNIKKATSNTSSSNSSSGGGGSTSLWLLLILIAGAVLRRKS